MDFANNVVKLREKVCFAPYKKCPILRRTFPRPPPGGGDATVGRGEEHAYVNIVSVLSESYSIDAHSHPCRYAPTPLPERGKRNPVCIDKRNTIPFCVILSERSESKFA